MSLFDKIANFYDRIVGPFNLEEILDYFSLEPNGLLIDLGGGTGRVAKQLVQHVSECLILDSSYDMLRQATDLSERIILLDSLAEQIPIQTGSIKQIFLNDSLHHIQKQKETLAECYRILASGGELIIREFDRIYFWNVFLIIMEFFLCFKSTFLTPKELSSMCQQLGFSTSIIRPTKATYIMIAKKE
ncbi:methyltransferase domain-containing protein [Candidatus Heimdallarchaeota archaeon]|nr:MAG: methyltransferase domain-containing protein [Candidatus Heimdallarchaeota archaeon]